MSIATAAFWAISLFMIHEFEEIIRVRGWIDRRQDDPRFAGDLWVAGRSGYPSTEAIAAMIGQEFVIATALLGVGIWAQSWPVVMGLTTANALHLVGHLVAAAQVRAWNPGSVTAALTLPPNLVLVGWALAEGMSLWWWLVASVVIGVVMVLNLRGLHRLAPRVQRALAG